MNIINKNSSSDKTKIILVEIEATPASPTPKRLVSPRVTTASLTPSPVGVKKLKKPTSSEKVKKEERDIVFCRPTLKKPSSTKKLANPKTA